MFDHNVARRAFHGLAEISVGKCEVLRANILLRFNANPEARFETTRVIESCGDWLKLQHRPELRGRLVAQMPERVV